MDTRQRNASTFSPAVAQAQERQTLPAWSCPAAHAAQLCNFNHNNHEQFSEENMFASVSAALNGSGASSPASWASPASATVHQITASPPQQLQQCQTAIKQYQPLLDESTRSVSLANTAAPVTPGPPDQVSPHRFEQHWQSMQQQQQQSPSTLSHAGMPAMAGARPSYVSALDIIQPSPAPTPGALNPTTDGSVLIRHQLHAVQGSPTVVHPMPGTAQMSDKADMTVSGYGPAKTHWSCHVYQPHAASNQPMHENAAALHLSHQQAHPGAPLPVGVQLPPAMSDIGQSIGTDDGPRTTQSAAACSAPFSVVTPTFTPRAPLLAMRTHPTAATLESILPTGASAHPHQCTDSTQPAPASAALQANKPAGWITPELLPDPLSHSTVLHNAAGSMHSPSVLAATTVGYPVSSTTHWSLQGAVPAFGHPHAVPPGMVYALPPQQTGSIATFDGAADTALKQAAHHAASTASSVGPAPVMAAYVPCASPTSQHRAQQEPSTQQQQQHQHHVADQQHQHQRQQQPHLWQQPQPQQQPTVLSSPHQPTACAYVSGGALLQNRVAGSSSTPAHQHATAPFLPGCWQQQHTGLALLPQIQTGQPQLVHVPLQLYATQGTQMGLPISHQDPSLHMMTGLVPLGGQVAIWPSPALSHPTLLQTQHLSSPLQHTTAAVVQGAPVWPGQHALYITPSLQPGTGFSAAHPQPAGRSLGCSSSSSLQTNVELQGRATAAAETPAAIADWDNVLVGGNSISNSMCSGSTTTIPPAVEATGRTTAVVTTTAGEVGFAMRRHATASGSSSSGRAPWLLQVLLRLPSGGTNSTSSPPSELQYLDAAAQLPHPTNPADPHTSRGTQSGGIEYTAANVRHYATLPAVRAMALVAQAPGLLVRGIWCVGSTAVWTSAASAHLVALGTLTICEYQLILLLVWLTLAAGAARAAYAAALIAASAARVGALLVTRETQLFVRAASVVATQDMRTLCVLLAVQPLALAIQEAASSRHPHEDIMPGAARATTTAGAAAMLTAGSTAARVPSSVSADAISTTPAHIAMQQHGTTHVQVGQLQPTLSMGWSHLLHSLSGRFAPGPYSRSLVAASGAPGGGIKPAASLLSSPSMPASTSRRSSMDHGNSSAAGSHTQTTILDGKGIMPSPFAAVLQQATINKVSIVCNVPAAATACASTGKRVSLEEAKAPHSAPRRVSRELNAPHGSLLPVGTTSSVLPVWGYSNPLKQGALEPGCGTGAIRDPGASTGGRDGDLGVPTAVLLVYDSLAVVSGLWAGLWVKLGLLVVVQGPLSACSIWWQAVQTGCCMSASAAATSAHTAMQAAWYLAHASLAVLGSLRTAAAAAASAAGASAARQRVSIDNPVGKATAGAAADIAGTAAAEVRSSSIGFSSIRAAAAKSADAAWSAGIGVARSLLWLPVQVMKGMQGMLAMPTVLLPGGGILLALLRSSSDCSTAAWTAFGTMVKGVWSWLASAQHGFGGLWRWGGFKACALHVVHLMGGVLVQLALWWMGCVEHCAALVTERLLQDAPPVARAAVYGSARMIRGLAIEAGRQSGCLAVQLLEVWMAH